VWAGTHRENRVGTLEDRVSNVHSGWKLAGSLAVVAVLSLARPSAGAAQDGQQIFTTRCAACHQADGSGIPGMFPPLAGSEWMTGDSGRPIRILLHGLEGETEVKGEVYSGMMPAWGGALSDAEIAAVLTYARSHLGNDAGPVTAAEVAKIRAATASRKTPWTAKELSLDAAKANVK
jgi:mono/diheme cytochrome c family protein